MIYFVLPIYNEEKNLRQVITKLRQLKKPSSYKIMAINDGSLDRSLQILQEMKGDDLFIGGSIINMNVGAVFSCGIDRVLSEAQDNDIMVIMESDQTSEIDFVQALILEIEKSNSDVVIASRYKKGGRYENFPLPRRLFSSWANYLMKVYFPIPHVEDYTIFFRAYRVRLLKKMVAYFGKFGLLQSKGFVANAELLVKASLFTNKFSEIPYVYDYKKKLGKSKINILRTINEYFVFIAYMKRIIKKSQALKSLPHTQGLPV